MYAFQQWIMIISSRKHFQALAYAMCKAAVVQFLFEIYSIHKILVTDITVCKQQLDGWLGLTINNAVYTTILLFSTDIQFCKCS